MSTKTWQVALLGAVVAGSVALGQTKPEPAKDHNYAEPSLVSRAWQFDATVQDPRPFAVKGSDGQTRWYWYVLYKVANHTGQERPFIPEVTMVTDEGDMLPAGRGVPAGVFEALKDRLGNKLLDSPADMVGKLLQGEDNAKESVAIWPALKHDVNHMTIFFGGLSGETQAVPHPVSKENVLLRKTLMIEYDLPGQPATPQAATLVPKGREWVMR